MFETAHALVHALNDITPLGLCAGLAFIIYQFVNKDGWAKKLSDNHLSGLPDMQASLKIIAENSTLMIASDKRQEDSLLQVRDGVNQLLGKAGK